ncbi:MAG: hypothetical protein JWO06_2058, partial [Bacteroidota bacterium]|nr:hypothetical protein [Bacteroidota bacterium]
MRGSSVILLVVFVFALGSCKSGSKVAGGSKKKAPVQVAKLDKPTQLKLDALFLDAEKAKVIEDWDNAIKQYNDVLAIDPSNSNAHFQLSQIYSGLHKLNESEQEAITATKLDANNKWYLEM